MFVELHILQNFAPSNLNRDDTGAPKDCEFGGYRRARISSQCLKRAIRTSFRKRSLIPAENLATRTKRLAGELAKRLEGTGKTASEAQAVVQAALRGVGLKTSDGKTEYLLYLGQQEIAGLADTCAGHWEALMALAAAEGTGDETGGRGSAKADKKADKKAMPVEVRKALESVMDGGKAADLALFGRMLADLPEKNKDAASQVAHAVSTNQVGVEFDFYTAVDDLKPDDTAGADMLGTVEFNSACFYRYANVDLNQLTRNLGGDRELALKTVEAFVRASVDAIPTGKQNSMAAQNRPSLVLAVVRESALSSLANAFVRPVVPDRSGDLVQNSVKALDNHWGQLTTMYGEEGIAGKWCASLDGDGLAHLKEARVPSIEVLVRNVSQAVQSVESGVVRL